MYEQGNWRKCYQSVAPRSDAWWIQATCRNRFTLGLEQYCGQWTKSTPGCSQPVVSRGRAKTFVKPLTHLASAMLLACPRYLVKHQRCCGFRALANRIALNCKTVDGNAEFRLIAPLSQLNMQENHA